MTILDTLMARRQAALEETGMPPDSFEVTPEEYAEIGRAVGRIHPSNSRIARLYDTPLVVIERIDDIAEVPEAPE